jgi:hypothetical protein
MASESVELVELSNDKVVQTVLPKPVVKTTVSVNNAKVSTPVRKATSVATTPAAPAKWDHISLAGHNITVEATASTAVDAGNVVKVYKDRFFYGHNSGTVFGFLPSVGVGTTFTVERGGVTRTYRISNKIQYAKSSATTLNYNGKDISMGHVALGYDVNEVKHSIVLMTCSGTSYGNGDASHRTVLFADAI